MVSFDSYNKDRQKYKMLYLQVALEDMNAYIAGEHNSVIRKGATISFSVHVGMCDCFLIKGVSPAYRAATSLVHSQLMLFYCAALNLHTTRCFCVCDHLIDEKIMLMLLFTRVETVTHFVDQ